MSHAPQMPTAQLQPQPYAGDVESCPTHGTPLRHVILRDGIVDATCDICTAEHRARMRVLDSSPIEQPLVLTEDGRCVHCFSTPHLCTRCHAHPPARGKRLCLACLAAPAHPPRMRVPLARSACAAKDAAPRVCGVCNEPIKYAGFGRPPTRCSQHLYPSTKSRLRRKASALDSSDAR